MLPCLLAIDTSTDLMAVAVLSPSGEFLANERGGPLASARLIPLLLGLLAEGGVRLSQVQAIAFGQGPGAFTGLRTASFTARIESQLRENRSKEDGERREERVERRERKKREEIER